LRVSRAWHAFCAAAAGLAFAGAAHAADEAVACVASYLAGVKTLSASFVQVVRDREGRITERATGALSIAGRPVRCYRGPRQVIVADGRSSGSDPDLQQVTVPGLRGPRLRWITNRHGRLADSFTSLSVESDSDWTWCRLKPLTTTSDFECEPRSDRRVACGMELVDKLGQTTRRLGLRLSTTLDPESFASNHLPARM
jgi:hypothetical protein